MEANNNFQNVLDADSKEMELWKIHLRHLLDVNKKGKNRRTRFDPMLLKWAIALLAKTSHSVYEEVARVMQLPTLSYILRKNKDIVGEQGVSGYYGIHITHISSMNKVLISNHNRIRGVISYDEMKTKEGIDWDFHS